MASDFLSKDVVYVNSRSRLSGNSNNFSIDLTGQIRTPNNYDTATLLSFYCPQSYYLIDSSNNSFNVNEFGTITVIDLPIGNYNINSLVVQLNARDLDYEAASLFSVLVVLFGLKATLAILSL